MTESMIAFVGLTHLGIVYSVCTAAKGFEVIGLDSEERIAGLQNGQLPIVEPGLPELFSTHRPALKFTSQAAALAKAELVFFSLDIPTDSDNRSNLQPLREWLAKVLAELSAGATAVILSQVPPGFSRSLEKEFHDLLSRRRLRLYYQVETLVFGNAVARALAPERFIVGASRAGEELPANYLRWLERFACPVLKMGYESAELTKIAINLFLVSTVSTTNTLAELCERIGADWLDIAPALRLDRRIGPHSYLSPGLGLSGGNLERDLATVLALAQENGTEAGIIRAWLADSNYRRDWVIRKVHQLILPDNPDPIFAVWGLAYKPHTHSTKNSPALAVVHALADFRLKAFDPEVRNVLPGTGRYQTSPSALAVCEDADALLVMTPWPEFASLQSAAVRKHMAGKVIIDPFGALPAAEYINAGFSYHCLGVPAQVINA